MTQASIRLREGTRCAHVRIESQPRLAHVLTANLTVREYAELLMLMHAFVRPLEHDIALHLGADLRKTLQARAKTGRLAKDIEALGYGVDLQRAPSVIRPDIESGAAALGAWYVLEGASLGGRVIVKQLHRQLGTSIAGATSFYEGHGQHTAATWREFQAMLDAALSSEHDITQAVAAANATFAALEQTLTQDITAQDGTPERH